MRLDKLLYKIFICILLVISLATLTKYILFKQAPARSKHPLSERTAKNWERSNYQQVNLQLFATIRRFNQHPVSRRYMYLNIGGNILGFVPLGFLFPLLLFRSGKAWKTLLLVFAISLFFELTQYYTGRGVFDVDDLLLNTTGGLIGFLVYAMLAGSGLLPGRTTWRPEKHPFRITTEN
ncbi:MAG: VanZ family protein [Chitinophagaceae bacterium]